MTWKKVIVDCCLVWNQMKTPGILKLHSLFIQTSTLASVLKRFCSLRAISHNVCLRHCQRTIIIHKATRGCLSGKQTTQVISGIWTSNCVVFPAEDSLHKKKGHISGTCDRNTSEKHSAAAPAAAPSVADYSLNAGSYHITLFCWSLALSSWQQSENCSRWKSSLEQQAGVHNKKPLHTE